MAIVSDVNILENIIKTRLVLDNGKKDENGEEKLSTEFYNYGKEEIKRINKKHGHGGHKKKEKDDDRPYHFAPVIFQVKFYHCLQVVF